MKRKLLVITAGTVVAGVGSEFVRQLAAHPASELHTVVRYIDTANLLTRYSGLHSGEWFQMAINPHFMDAVRRNPQQYPELDEILFPGIMPEIQGSGGGSIRYNAAGAFIINRQRMKDWLTSSITNLVRSDEGQVELSFALVISAVGATGSGTVERMLDLIIDCAQTANIPDPIHCDVYILQPGMYDVSDLGLSNTVAMYAEMAASRLAYHKQMRSYRGRTLIVGWGTERYLSSLDQLQEATATLLRLSHDPATSLAAEFQEREVDNHVLREQDWQTQLPSHLSTATAVTINLGDLEERIIQHDAIRLTDTLVFGKQSPASNDTMTLSTSNQHDDTSGQIAQTAFDFLQGDLPEDRYRNLVARLTEDLSLTSFSLTAARLQGMSNQHQAARLRGSWQSDRNEITRYGRQQIREQGTSLVEHALRTLEASRHKGLATHLSLQDLRSAYRTMEQQINATQSVTQNFSVEAYSENDVQQKLAALDHAYIRKEQALQQAINAVQSNLQDMLQREAHTVAMEVLRILHDHCNEALRNMDIVLNNLWRQRRNNPRWNAQNQQLRIETNHPLHLAALANEEEILHYANLVSIFTSSTTGSSFDITGQAEDQVGTFRKWLADNGHLDEMFRGDIDTILELAETFARDYVHRGFKEHSVLDILTQSGDDLLQQRLKEALERATSLVPFSPQFASEHREARHVCAYWKNEEQRALLQKTINQAFSQSRCTLLSSQDPSEIVVFYYVDGLPMSAINDLSGRCLDAFLKRRLSWYRQYTASSNLKASNNGLYKQRVGVPVYSGHDAEVRVLETGVIRQLYHVRGQSVTDYTTSYLPELADNTTTDTVEQSSGGST